MLVLQLDADAECPAVMNNRVFPVLSLVVSDEPETRKTKEFYLIGDWKTKSPRLRKKLTKEREAPKLLNTEEARGKPTTREEAHD